MLAIDMELKALIAKLGDREVPHALCGGLAMAVYGYPRATLDIDLLALRGSAALIEKTAREIGYTLNAAPMEFADGKVKIIKVSKISADALDVLPLDILTLVPEIEETIDFEEIEWEESKLRVVSRKSLIRLKQIRGSHQDRADIEKLAS